MPKISTFVYSDNVSAEPAPNGSQSITIQNPMVAFKPTFIPSLFSFAITIGIIDLDLKVNHSFRFTFGKVNEEVLIDTNEMQLPANNQPIDEEMAVPARYRGVIFNLDFRNVVFKTEGEYESNIYLDGEHLGNYPIYVKGVEASAR